MKLSTGKTAVLATTLVILGSILACFSQANSQRASVEENPVRDVEVDSAWGLYPRALDEATNWQGDAQLVKISMDVHPLKLYTFNFETPSHSKLSYSVNFSPDNGGMAMETTEFQSTSDSEEAPIQLGALTTDSQEAFDIAISAGGDRFVRENGSTGLIWLLQLWHWNRLDGQLAWRVMFSGIRGPSWEAFINPMDGEIIAIEENQPANPQDL